MKRTRLFPFRKCIRSRNSKIWFYNHNIKLPITLNWRDFFSNTLYSSPLIMNTERNIRTHLFCDFIKIFFRFLNTFHL